MYIVIFIPFFLALLFCIFRSTQRAFLDVYLPFLLFFPFASYLDLPGMHGLNFAHLAIIPIFGSFLLSIYFKKPLVNWNFNIVELLVILYFFVCIYSESYNAGTTYDTLGGSMTINLAVSMACSVLFPFFLGKYLVFPSGIFVTFCRRFIIYILIDLVLCAYEWRMTDSLFMKVLNPFFASQLEQPFQLRGGMVRITGPFSHPILFGIVIAIALFLNHWLTRNHFWKRNFSFLPPLLVSKGNIISFFLFLGLILTFSRAPLISTIIAGLFVGLGYSKNKKISLAIRSLIVILGLSILSIYYASFTEIDPEGEVSESAFYRTQLFTEYQDILYERFWLGWGSIGLIVKNQMKSIDNHYLWLALKHGIFAVLILLSLLLSNMIQLFFQGMNRRLENKNALAFTLFSIIFMITLSITTVYMGAQIEPILFLLLGISQSFLATNNSKVQNYLNLKPFQGK
jgi:hypothetical protein